MSYSLSAAIVGYIYGADFFSLARRATRLSLLKYLCNYTTQCVYSGAAAAVYTEQSVQLQQFRYTAAALQVIRLHFSAIISAACTATRRRRREFAIHYAVRPFIAPRNGGPKFYERFAAYCSVV